MTGTPPSPPVPSTFDELVDSDGMYRDLVEHASDGIAVVQDGVIHFVNPCLPTLLGYTKEEVLGTSYTRYLTPESLETVVKNYQGLSRGDVPDIYEASFLHKNGEALLFEINTSVISYKNRTADFVIFRSLEDRRAQQRLLEKMLRYQKLESLGVLAGGISHDFNNLLQGILGNADLALMYDTDPALVQTCLKDIKAAALKASSLALQMLAYSGKGACDFEEVNLNHIIADTAGLLDSFFSRRALLKYELAPDLPPVRADRTQLGQILINLVTNAAEAVGDESGIVTLSSGEIYLSHEALTETVHGSTLRSGDYVFVEIADTGVGIPQDVQDRIFDPFFTTKFTGRGLGLATVFGIVRAHFGAVSVSSTRQRGTVFRVFLPVPGRSENTRTSSIEPPAVENRAQGTILFVDDDITIRSTGARILERFGYAVVEAADGRSAIDIYKKNQNRIQAVLLDMMMPQVDGKETFLALQRINENVKTILMSGYAEDEVRRQFKTKGGPTGFLQKPFSAKKLINIIREVLK